MLTLGIETSCDETGIALVRDGREVISNQVLSQIPLHERFGGVVPEIASRAHVEAITRVVEKCLADGDLDFKSAPKALDCIAVAHRPGLVGSLLIGVTAAKSLSWAWGVPLVGVDHIHAHIYSAAMTAKEPETERYYEDHELFPAVSLVVSGGHTSIYQSSSWVDHELMGATLDDAVGEAFDKAASILGLEYPGGPAISKQAVDGNEKAFPFKKARMNNKSLDFSFSGIKTAVLYTAKGQNARKDAPLLDGLSIPDVCASFEETVVSTVVKKLQWAAEKTQAKTALVGGGVAANGRLRSQLAQLGQDLGIKVLIPPWPLCTDNGAMIAGLGYRLFEAGNRSDLSLDADPITAR